MVASFTEEVNQRLAKRPLKTNGRLANRGLTSLVKEATLAFTIQMIIATPNPNFVQWYSTCQLNDPHNFILPWRDLKHYNDVIMSTIASQITSLTIVYSTVYSDADQRKHQSSASLAICAGNSPGTGEFPVQRASNAENVSIWWRHHEP